MKELLCDNGSLSRTIITCDSRLQSWTSDEISNIDLGWPGKSVRLLRLNMVRN